MNYHYTESGLDHIWLEDGFTLENHPNYGELVSIWNARGLHLAIGRWLIGQPRRLTGAEFRFLRTEMDLSQRLLGQLLGVTDRRSPSGKRPASGRSPTGPPSAFCGCVIPTPSAGAGSLPRFSTRSTSSTPKWQR